MSFLRIIGVSAILAVVGCGSDIDKKTSVNPTSTPAATAAKAVLEDVAKSGERGSGMMGLKDSLEEVKKADAAKGDALLKELDALEKTTDPAAIKAKAKAMADKL